MFQIVIIIIIIFNFVPSVCFEVRHREKDIIAMIVARKKKIFKLNFKINLSPIISIDCDLDEEDSIEKSFENNYKRKSVSVIILAPKKNGVKKIGRIFLTSMLTS